MISAIITIILTESDKESGGRQQREKSGSDSAAAGERTGLVSVVQIQE